MVDNNIDVRFIGEKLFYGVNVSYSYDERGGVLFGDIWSGVDEGLGFFYVF